ncbi:hypothetical protein DYH09_25140 [bacterium CPR1]|nr:hypothetical protein [bacterium CPR1]
MLPAGTLKTTSAFRQEPSFDFRMSVAGVELAWGDVRSHSARRPFIEMLGPGEETVKEGHAIG